MSPPEIGSWTERFRDWRSRTVAKPAFQRWAAAFLPTRWIVRKQAGELFDLVAGFVYSQVLQACVRLKLFDMLADGPQPMADLAVRLKLSPDAAHRLLAAAASLELVERRSGDRFALGRLGAPLVGNTAITSMIEHHATLYGDLADPVALLRGNGRPPAMAGYWPYAAHDGQATSRLTPEQVAEYSTLMSMTQPLVAAEVLQAYSFEGHRCLLDIGGGEGTFLRAVAQHAPHLQLKLFDLPAVAARAHVRLEAWGLGSRAQALGGDFFVDELPRGADIVSMIRVAFDHPDERVLALLRSVRRALPDDGTLLLAEPMAGAPGAAAMGDAYFGFYLLAMGRGRPRSASDLSALLVEAGFDGGRSLPTLLPLQTGIVVARCRHV
jgi:demethylspheroidene O-methyltransferase